jgi:hypothetical protein
MNEGPDLDLSRLTFKFAKRMPDIPHEYVIRSAENEADYVALFDTIQRDGVYEKFGKRRYRYWYAGDHKYWTMTTDAKQSRVINRAAANGEPDEMNLTAEDLACAGLHRAGDEWSFKAIEREIDPDADRRDLEALVAALSPPKRRERKPSLAAALKEANKAGRPVRGAALYADRVEITFGEPSKVAADDPIDTPEALRRLI